MKRFLFLVALLAGCKSLPFPEPRLEGDYGAALKRWTRTVVVYSGLETRTFTRMIYLSPEFVTAQAKEISRLRAELPDQAAATLEKLRAENHAPSFFAITYMPDRTANDWESKHSVWRIALNMGTGEKEPASIVRFERPFSAELRALYPYLDEYSTAYQIRFPEVPAQTQAAAAPGRPLESMIPDEVHMVIAGAPGKMTFNWRMDGGAETPSTGEESRQRDVQK